MTGKTSPDLEMLETNGETLLQSYMYVQKCMKRIKQVIMGEILKVLGLCIWPADIGWFP